MPRKEESPAISLVQRGNLKSLEATLRKQWRLGQNIVLCWSADERGLLVIWVPHYFLGNYCAHPGRDGSDNEQFVRELISGTRRKTREELFAIAARLDVAPSFVKLATALSEDSQVQLAVEQVIKRYGLGYVECRGVLLFDIAEFSLFTPFEQASQLNSLSYSMNSAYNKLQAQGIEINFARTTTGDGYYVWNRDMGAYANQNLFLFMLLVVADNAVARAASRGNTVPVIRTAFHAGSHYELYQAEGVNPTVFSYIVGEVTIDLARIVDLAQPHQIMVGDFTSVVRSHRERRLVDEELPAPAFVKHCNSELGVLQGLQLSGKSIARLSCRLTGEGDSGERRAARRFKVTDKHGLSRHAYNLQLSIELEGQTLELGLAGDLLPGGGDRRQEDESPTVEKRRGTTEEDVIDDLAALLKKRPSGSVSED
ncbi:hypothetical protein [Parahaliea mediterranea]|uniref:Uncharacterized protein n=1 Tax=Parahaliea mediterranea TaxID=651086 RepID=A0A939DJ75_9GAMM|nr:hypothetical protein [Parahaliea mediterranea]MBN7798447.1 hypothetical protein [Parahaliea mediterranea]